jgi:hypothetical protein
MQLVTTATSAYPCDNMQGMAAFLTDNQANSSSKSSQWKLESVDNEVYTRRIRVDEM